MADALSAIRPPVVLASGDPRPNNVKEAATQFEALLVAQMLKEMRTASGSDFMGTGEDQSGACMLDYAEEHLSQVLAQQGGLGLARMVVAGLERKPAANAIPSADQRR